MAKRQPMEPDKKTKAELLSLAHLLSKARRLRNPAERDTAMAEVFSQAYGLLKRYNFSYEEAQHELDILT